MVDTNFSPGLGRKISKVPRSVIEEQDIYKRGLIRFGKDANELINTVTGKVYENLNQAIIDTTIYGFSEVNVLTGTRGVLSTDPFGYAPLSDLTYNINQYLNLDTPEAKGFRSRHTILSELEGKNIELVRIGYSKTAAGTMAQMTLLYDDPVSFGDTLDDLMQGNMVQNLRSRKNFTTRILIN